MEGQWTFSPLDTDWGYDVYDTKEDVLIAAKERFKDGCIIGQLEHHYGVNYRVINQEKVMFNYYALR